MTEGLPLPSNPNRLPMPPVGPGQSQSCDNVTIRKTSSAEGLNLSSVPRRPIRPAKRTERPPHPSIPVIQELVSTSAESLFFTNPLTPN